MNINTAIIFEYKITKKYVNTCTLLTNTHRVLL